MSTDARSPQVAATTRADIARLTLRLRTALRDAEEAEQQRPEVARVCAELEARLASMLEERRIAMEAELAAARAESARVIAEAQARGDELLAQRAAERAAIAATIAEQRAAAEQAAARVAAEQAAADQAAAAFAAAQAAARATAAQRAGAVPPISAVAPATATGSSVPPIAPPAVASGTPSFDHVVATGNPWAPAAPGTVSSVHEAPTTTHGHAFPADPSAGTTAAPASASAGFPAVAGPVPPVISTNVVIDAEAFARVFAQVVGRMIDERIPQPQALGLPYVQQAAPPPVAVPVKQTFWANARHLDVMLLGLTSVIVLVVLAAWLV